MPSIPRSAPGYPPVTMRIVSSAIPVRYDTITVPPCSANDRSHSTVSVAITYRQGTMIAR